MRQSPGMDVKLIYLRGRWPVNNGALRSSLFMLFLWRSESQKRNALQQESQMQLIVSSQCAAAPEYRQHVTNCRDPHRHALQEILVELQN